MDLATLMRIRSLELRAKVVVEGFWRGIHRSPFHGFSVEFSEYRPYSPGDDWRYVDWRLYARTDRFYVKRFADETNLRCLLAMDHSRSMAYGTTGYTKWDYARTLAAALGYLLFWQGDAVGLATFDSTISDYIPPRNRPGYLRHLLGVLEHGAVGRGTDLDQALQRIWQVMKTRQMVILISDLMAAMERIDLDLGYLRAAGHDLIVFQVLDPVEVSLQINRPAIFQDMETGQRIPVDPSSARRHYTDRLNRHLDMLRSACQGLGVDYHLCTTDQPMGISLLRFLQHRAFTRRHLSRPLHQARRDG